MRIDNLRKCEYKDGCNNLARINQVINNQVKRAKLCEKHHRLKHPRTNKFWRSKSNFVKCDICKWEGPCDGHRINTGGKYIKENIVSICPNCHRLVHLGVYKFEGKLPIKNEGKLIEVLKSNGWKMKWFDK